MADDDSIPAPEIITRAQATERGLTRYFTGKPCKHGHVTTRERTSGSCSECSRLACERRRADDPEKWRQLQKLWRDSQPDRIERRRAAKRAKDPAFAERSARRALDAEARAAARAAGSATYKSMMPCIHGHVGVRMTKGYQCFECHLGTLVERDHAAEAERRAKREASKAWKRARDEVTANRLAAIDRGETTYLGAACRKGHSGVRYVCGYACVECPKESAFVATKSEYDKQHRAKKGSAYYTEKSRAWSKKNPGRRRTIVAAYTARRRSIEKGGDPTWQIHAWEKAAPKLCYWCGCKCADKYHVDHYEPLAKGGLHVISNLVIACPPCNLKKNAKDPYQFAQEKGKLF